MRQNFNQDSFEPSKTERRLVIDGEIRPEPSESFSLLAEHLDMAMRRGLDPAEIKLYLEDRDISFSPIDNDGEGAIII